MHIFFDAQPIAAQLAGVGRYCRELVTALAPILDPKRDRLTLGFFDFRRRAAASLTSLLEALPADAPVHLAPVRTVPGRYVQAAWKYFGAPPWEALFPATADVVHFPNFALPPTRHRACVCTVHDLSFVRFPQFADDRNRRWLTKAVPRAVARARLILADSEFSRREILEVYGASPERVVSIPLACSPHFQPSAGPGRAREGASHGWPDRFFLSVGTLEPRKNLAALLEAFAIGCRDRRWPEQTGLVLAGMRGWKMQSLLDSLAAHPFRDRIHLAGYLQWEHLPALYSAALALICTSFYEGFGMPVLEAMACGTPVITSDAASLPEVGGDAVLYAAPHDVAAFAAHMAAVAADPALRERLRRAGLQRACLFSWEKTARETLAAYRHAAGTRPAEPL